MGASVDDVEAQAAVEYVRKSTHQFQLHGLKRQEVDGMLLYNFVRRKATTPYNTATFIFHAQVRAL